MATRHVLPVIFDANSTAPTEPDREWNIVAFVIAEPCIGVRDAACVDACPVECIHPKRDESGSGTEAMLFINPVECIDCGACVPVCPVEAIYAEGDLPDKWYRFVEINANHYLK